MRAIDTAIQELSKLKNKKEPIDGIDLVEPVLWHQHPSETIIHSAQYTYSDFYIVLFQAYFGEHEPDGQFFVIVNSRSGRWEPGQKEKVNAFINQISERTVSLDSAQIHLW